MKEPDHPEVSMCSVLQSTIAATQPDTEFDDDEDEDENEGGDDNDDDDNDESEASKQAKKS